MKLHGHEIATMHFYVTFHHAFRFKYTEPLDLTVLFTNNKQLPRNIHKGLHFTVRPAFLKGNQTCVNFGMLLLPTCHYWRLSSTIPIAERK